MISVYILNDDKENSMFGQMLVTFNLCSKWISRQKNQLEKKRATFTTILSQHKQKQGMGLVFGT